MARPAYARQMLAVLGVDNPAIEAAFAAVPRELFFGPPPWTVSSPYGGTRRLSGADSANSVEKQPTVAYSHIS